MTTDHEKTCVDLIFAALNGLADGHKTKKGQVIAKISVTLGVLAHVCIENGISEQTAIECLKHRFADYRETFDGAANSETNCVLSMRDEAGS